MNRLADAEDALEACAAALFLIPVWALRRGHQWTPSAEAVQLIAEAKDALNKYSQRHTVNGHD